MKEIYTSKILPKLNKVLGFLMVLQILSGLFVLLTTSVIKVSCPVYRARWYQLILQFAVAGLLMLVTLLIAQVVLFRKERKWKIMIVWLGMGVAVIAFVLFSFQYNLFYCVFDFNPGTDMSSFYWGPR